MRIPFIILLAFVAGCPECQTMTAEDCRKVCGPCAVSSYSIGHSRQCICDNRVMQNYPEKATP